MNRKLIAFVLIISMIMPLAGCGKEAKKPAMSEKLLAEAVLNEENLVLAVEGVELRLNPVFVSTDVKASISQVSNAQPLDEEEDVELKVYDFKVDGVEKVDGVIQLAIPLKIPDGETVGAAYLNEETGTWEPVSFYYDVATSSVMIATDHLSKYGVFTVSKEGTRRARLEFLGLYGEGTDENFLAAIEEYSIGGVPASECYEIGMGAVGDGMQLGGDVLGNLTQSVGYLAYGDDVLSNIGDQLGSIGLLLSVVQIGNNIYNGNINDAVVGSLKTSLTYVMGKAASKLSSSVMSASMASVAIVDYAINKFGTTAIEGRADIYREAYNIYYNKSRPGYKSSAYWYKTFYPLFTNQSMTQDALKAEVDKMVIAHCDEFWNANINTDGVEFYMTEARENLKFTGGAGLNKELEKTISQERRSNLYNDVLPGVFYQIAQKMNMDNEAKLRAQYKELTDYMNTVISFRATDPTKTYAKYQARFSPLNEEADIANWTGKFKEDGTLNTSFTLYGHLKAGSPYQLNLYEPNADLDKEKPVETIEFKVTPPSIELIIAKEPGRLTRLVSMKTSEEAVAGLLQEDEYKSYFAENMHPLPLEHLLSQQSITIPESNVIDIDLNGSWATDTVSGKNQSAEWTTQYKYDVQNFHLNIPISVNQELPVIGTDKTGLLLDGAGTYSLTVTITTITSAKQEVPAIGEKAWIDATVTRSTTFTSTGEVRLYTLSNAIDDSKPVTVLENGIENLETKGVILDFLNPVNQANVVETNSTKTTWEDKTEKEETNTNEYMIDTTYILDNAYKVYFKYPVK